MISSLEVGSVFRLVDEASPTLMKIAVSLKVLRGLQLRTAGMGAGCVKTLEVSGAPPIFEACGLAEREKPHIIHTLRGHKGSLAEFSHGLGG